MDTLQATVLGLVQGLTEFIPVSSSGHLVIGQHFLLGASSHQFLEFINIGTLLALIAYFWRRITIIYGEVVEQKKYTLLRNILLTSIPAGIVGYFLSDIIDHISFFGSVKVVVTTLAVVGVVMIVLDKLPRLTMLPRLEDMSWKRAFAIGVAQMFALIPGVSRSGSTIIAGRLVGLGHQSAAEYSFLASLPIMLGVTVKLFITSTDRMYFVDNFWPLLIGNVVAFIAGILAIRFLISYLSKHNLTVFGWYRLALAGVVGLILLLQ